MISIWALIDPGVEMLPPEPLSLGGMGGVLMMPLKLVVVEVLLLEAASALEAAHMSSMEEDEDVESGVETAG
jgi:hypothetical protein